MKLFTFVCALFFVGQLSAQTWEHLTPLSKHHDVTCGFNLNDSITYLGGTSRNLMQTKNSGETWARNQETIANFPVQYSSAVGGIHFTSVNVGYITSSQEIYKTTDGNATWTEVYTSAEYYSGVHFRSVDTGYVSGTNGTLLRTVDAGNTWSIVPTGISTLINSMRFVSSSTFYLLTDSQILLKTIDSGVTWTTIDPGASNPIYSFDFNGDIGITVGLTGEVRRTIDGGATWSAIAWGTTQRLTGIRFLDATTVLACGWNGEIIQSTDAGASFSTTPTITTRDLYNFVRVNQTTIYCHGDGFILESLDNGLTWSFRFDGVNGGTVQRIYFNQQGVGHAASSLGGGNPGGSLMRTEDYGRVWIPFINGSFNDICFYNSLNGYASGAGGYRSTIDGGISWTWNYRPGTHTSIFFLNSSFGFLGSFGDGLYKTTNGGSTWTNVYPVSFGTEISDIYFSDNLTGCATIENGTIIKTIDGGLTWTVVLTGFGNPLALEFPTPLVGYTVNSTGGVQKSIDSGTSWSPVTGNQHSIEFPAPAAVDSGYALHKFGFLSKTLDGGITWDIIVNPLPQMPNMTDLTIHDNYAYATGDGGQIYRAKLPCQPNSSSLVISQCDDYTAPDGQIYSSSGLYSAYLTNLYGCDSLINIDLTINGNSFESMTITACNSYSAPDGQSLTASGLYSITIPNSAGCDSIIDLDLTINTVDVSVNQTNDITLEALISNADYQWLDCNNNYDPVVGATNQNFVATINGQYAVQISEPGCIDTSACFIISNVGIMENDFGMALQISPNPTNKNVSISFGELIENVDVRVLNMSGEIVQETRFNETEKLEIALDGSAGYYIIELISGKKYAKVKVLKTN
jgi:photosystem II stability/assembly factor-like uncharacterized protein